MNIELLKKLGNIRQIAGITEARLSNGRAEGVQVAQFHNAAGLRFSVMPDRGMDIFDMSYKGVNLSFQTKNGLTAPQAFTSADGEFFHQWSGGMVSTCGLDNVGGHCVGDDIFPIHGRISYMPAEHYGTETVWEGDTYYLRAQGETHLTRLYGRHLSVRRTVETTLEGKSLRMRDKITNFQNADEPFMLLYHCNFGYPLLDENSVVMTNAGTVKAMHDQSFDPHHMHAPIDGHGDEMFMQTNLPKKTCALLWNPDLDIAAYLSFDSTHLPNMLEWKKMQSHDYVLALEPCNTYGFDRLQEGANGTLAVIPAYSSIDIDLEIGVLDGKDEIQFFIQANGLTAPSMA